MVKRNVRARSKDEGQCLVDYLCKRFTYFTKAQWEKEIKDGRILVNGEKSLASRPLWESDDIAFTPLPYSEPEVCDNWKIALETDDYLFIDKPAHLPCHPAGRYLKNTLYTMLRARYGEVFFVTRLDRETTGIVLVAKNSASASWAAKEMEKGNMEKTYRVLVSGFFPDKLDASGVLVRDGLSPIRKKQLFIPDQVSDGQSCPGVIRCRTEFERVSFYEKRNISLLKARLHTGKTHQIRATLHSIGYPVIGDKLYGPNPHLFISFSEGKLTEEDRNLLVMDHQALHCLFLSFKDKDGRILMGTAPLPETWICEK